MLRKYSYLTKPLTVVKPAIVLLATFFSACSFVELNPGARHIIFANNDSCDTITRFEAKVATKNAFINRSDKAISEELQILAQNSAYEQGANAIWPDSDIVDGVQSFLLLTCRR